MSLMAQGMAFVGEKLATAAGVSVSYVRKGTTATLTVVPGEQTALAMARLSTQAASVAWSQRDYLIDAADFAAAGFDGTPQTGDRIVETVAGAEAIFELRPGPNGEPCWRWSETDRLTYRVHTKKAN